MDINPFEVSQKQLDNAAKRLNLDPKVHEALREPMRVFEFDIPVEMDSGEVKTFTGFRVQYNDAMGPCKGGIRFHPDENLNTIKALAAWMTVKRMYNNGSCDSRYPKSCEKSMRNE